MSKEKKALNANILYLMFDTANMHRWNDHLRTIDLTELDKQAHKAAIAWVIGKYEETEGGSSVDWTKIIENSLFSFIQRSVLTDLKPQVFHRVISEKSDEVNKYVMETFDKFVPDSDPNFRNRLQRYLRSDKKSKEDDIISAAHYLATKWEFDAIYDANRSRYGIEETKKKVYLQTNQHKDLAGVKEILCNQLTFGFIDLIGQLRFQQRWARTPRIPKTTVLGHSLLVANMIYLCDVDRNASDRQIYTNYYTALFHDLPEVLTKDVISPIKENVAGLAELLESYERELVELEIMPLVPEAWQKELRTMVLEPFEGVEDEAFRERTGPDIKSCDMMAAYIEAKASVYYGISSRPLVDGIINLKKNLKERGTNIGAKELLEDLDELLDSDELIIDCFN